MDLRSPTTAALVLLLCGCNGTEAGLPAKYREVAVPAAVLQAQDARLRGRALFLEHCALCHGEAADGHGVRRNLSSRPADFTDPLWLERTSARRIFFVIREGVQGTAMAGWKIFDEEQTWDLVAYVISVAGPAP